MITKEIAAANYMEALLRASLILSDLRPSHSISTIVICTFHCVDHQRILQIRCKITVESDNYSSTVFSPGDMKEAYRIVYPAFSTPAPR